MVLKVFKQIFLMMICRGVKEKANINKQRSPHAVNYGTDYFVVYPNRMGCPLCFVKDDNRKEDVQ